MEPLMVLRLHCPVTVLGFEVLYSTVAVVVVAVVVVVVLLLSYAPACISQHALCTQGVVDVWAPNPAGTNSSVKWSWLHLHC